MRSLPATAQFASTRLSSASAVIKCCEMRWLLVRAGSYDERWLLTEEQCKNLCGTLWFCKAIEYSINGVKGYSKQAPYIRTYIC